MTAVHKTWHGHADGGCPTFVILNSLPSHHCTCRLYFEVHTLVQGSKIFSSKVLKYTCVNIVFAERTI
jgi:hypothetical protein